jgi:cbb3-type cytochrome oxidase maturation protein
MNILSLLIPLALGLGLFFVGLFIWATRSGQWDDLDTPAQRMLIDAEDHLINNNTEQNNKGRKHE